MANGGFFGGFAQGLSRTAGAGMAARQRREAEEARRLELQQRQQQWESEHSLEQQKFQFEQNKFGATQKMEELEQQFRQKQLQVQEKEADLKAIETITKLADPALPAPLKKLGWKQFFRSLGEDPDSPENKETMQALQALQDEEIRGLTQGLLLFAKDAQPGELRQLVKTALQQKIPITDLMTQFRELQKQQLEERKFESEQSNQQQLLDRIGQGSGSGAQQEVEALAALSPEGNRVATIRREVDPQLREQKTFAEEEGKRKAAARSPMPASTKTLLGLGGVDLTVGEAAELGVHTDLLDAKTTRELLQQKSQTQTALRSIDSLAEMVRGRPELLGASGAIVRGTNSLIATISGLTRLAPGGLTLDETIRELMESADVKKVLDQNLSGESATVRSRVVDLAYTLVSAQKSGRLSNQDIERSIAQLGDSSDPNQFTTVLADLRERIRSSTAESIAGVTGFPPIEFMEPDELHELSLTLDDERVLNAILKELLRRK